jgi:diguanylate cyclase (GGDEF)-like protein
LLSWVPVRLITRNDTTLAVALIASTLVLFQQPLQYVINAAQDVEARYHVDLIPALLLLVVVFIFHEYQKHAQATADARAAAAEAVQARTRSEELEQLMAFGQGLANAFEPSTLQQTLWKFLPAFAHSRPFWVLTYKGNRWTPLVHDGNMSRLETLEQLATQVVAPGPLRSTPVVAGSDAEILLPLIAGGAPVGVIGIGNVPELSAQERKAWGAVAAVLAIGVRNMQLFVETRELSLHDALTGCFNRAYALDALDNEIRRSRRNGCPLSILMFDIDHFKAINDRLGHLIGDDVLQRVGAQLGRILRSSDVRCRFGGDEFLVVLPDTPLSGAEQVAESVRREIGALVASTGDVVLPITVSVGVAVAVPTDRAPENVIERADSALYESKRAGRDRVSAGPLPPLALVHSEPAAVARLR